MKGLGFVLFQNCKLTFGHTRSTIADLQRRRLLFIPNFIAELITKSKWTSLETLNNKEDGKLYIDYLDFLVDEKVGFYIEEKDSAGFVNLNEEYETPNLIDYAIIDINEENLKLFFIAFDQIIDIRCQHLHLRSFGQLSEETLCRILDHFKHSAVENIELLIQDFPELDKNYLNSFSAKYPRVTDIIIHSSNKEIATEDVEELNLIFTKEKINSEAHCGYISTELFSINYYSYLESKNANSCLNKKVGIDSNGNIKNCPSLTQSFGNIIDTKLRAVLDQPEFKKVWSITKDDIEICKSCEFRQVCTDCRAYLQDPENGLSKPLKCGYDPFIGEWSDWEKLADNLKGIEYYKF